MGGGDLNLKKSWHPSTLRNIERVWKAEQKHSAEQQKIEQLQKELQDERNRDEIRQFAENKGVIGKKSDRLDWMYAGPAAMVDRDEYLLGRTVDKTFEVMDSHAQGLMNETVNDAALPGAIFNRGNVNVSVDLANKVKEDPLFAIKKKEQQAKKDILRNPVKMKQLQKFLEENVKKSHKKKSKKKKKKKAKYSSSSSEDSEVDYKRENRKSKSKHVDLDSSTDYKSRNYSDGQINRRNNNKFRLDDDRSRSRKRLSKEESLSSDDEPKRRRKDNRHEKKLEETVSRKRKFDSSDEDVKPKRYGLIGGNKKKAESPPGRVDYRKIKIEKPQGYKREPRRKLTAEEIEKRRLEMMDNAKWRDEQRSNNVRRYREESAKEVEEHSKSNGAKFITPMLAKAVESSSVEARLKSNKYKIQRSGSELNGNFAKR